jgi:hypothetical protein
MKHTSLKIGRAQDNDIVLTHHSVSRYHLEVFIDEHGSVFITDLKSSNGTYVNGNRIEGSVLVNKGDILKLGADKPLQWQRWVQHMELESPIESPLQDPYFYQPNKSFSVAKIVISIIAAFLFIIIVYVIYHNQKKNEDSPTTISSTETDSMGTDSQVASPTDNGINIPMPTTKKSVRRNNKIIYDFSCLSDPNDHQQTDILNNGSDINDLVIDALGNAVEMGDEVEYGNDIHTELQHKYNFIYNGSAHQKLQQILSKLTDHISNPRGFYYKLFLVQSDELNAFTAGGRIYITTSMYNFCKTDDELACVIGHEINHNELGHIKQNIKMTSMPGAELMMLITTPFNQKKETACDLQGIDLAIASGYEGCASVQVWKRMSDQVDYNQYDPLENLFRTHPYSSKREKCSKNHITVNYLNSPCVP